MNVEFSFSVLREMSVEEFEEIARKLMAQQPLPAMEVLAGQFYEQGILAEVAA